MSATTTIRIQYSLSVAGQKALAIAGGDARRDRVLTVYYSEPSFPALLALSCITADGSAIIQDEDEDDVATATEALRNLDALLTPTAAITMISDWHARREASAKASAVANAAKKTNRGAEQAAWIIAHGSDLIKSCLAEEIECLDHYRTERLAHERPGWLYCDNLCWDPSAPNSPPSGAFDLLAQAREVEPKAKLVYYYSYTSNSGCHAATAEWRGEMIIFFADGTYDE